MDEVLKEMASLEGKCSQLRASLETNPLKSQLLESDQRLKSITDTVDLLKTEIFDLEERISLLESDSKPLRSRLVTLEEQERSGDSVSYRDATAHGHQLEVARGRLEELEEQELALMESLEEKNESLQDLSRSVSELTAENISLRAELDEMSVTLKTELDGYEAALNAVVGESLDAEAQRIYSRMREKMGGSVVAVVKNDACGGCGVRISNRILGRLRGETALGFAQRSRCEECDRVMVL